MVRWNAGTSDVAPAWEKLGGRPRKTGARWNVLSAYPATQVSAQNRGANLGHPAWATSRDCPRFLII